MASVKDDNMCDEETEDGLSSIESVNDILDNIDSQSEPRIRSYSQSDRSHQMEMLTKEFDKLLDELKIPMKSQDRRNVGNLGKPPPISPPSDPVFNPYQDSNLSTATTVKKNSILKTPVRAPIFYNLDPRKQDLSIVKLKTPLNTQKTELFYKLQNEKFKRDKVQRQFSESQLPTSDRMINEYMENVNKVCFKIDIHTNDLQ